MPFRKALRNHGTAAEAVLWTCLKGKQSGRKFRRQHSIGNMIVHFYCPAEALIVELDGDGHFSLSGQADNIRRDQRLEQLGFTVIRFENKDVFENIESVLVEIKRHFTGSPPCAPREKEIIRLHPSKLFLIILFLLPFFQDAFAGKAARLV
jgi:very-short-patch-repair endonuclease